MFEIKKTSLFAAKKQQIEKPLSEMNIFEKEQFSKSHQTTSGNGSLKLSTTGNSFVDDFANIGRYRTPRTMSEIFATMEKLWAIDNLLCIKEMVYIRTITRDTKLPDGTKLEKQVGQGLKAEVFGRMLWLAIKHPDVFYKNLHIFIVAGSWDDVFELMRIDLSYEHDHGKLTVLDWDKLIAHIVVGLSNPNESELVKKYLPTIKAKSKCTTLRSQCNNYIANKIASTIFAEEVTPASRQKKYRLLKTSGKAHEFQKLISQGKFDQLDFSHIPGRVLGQLVYQRMTVTKNGKKVKSDGTSFLQRHGLEKKYEQWLDKQPVAKFTGFVYELFKPLMPASYCISNLFKISKLQQKTINKQFYGLIEEAKKNMNCESSFLCCLDTSPSMSSCVSGTDVSAKMVARSMGLYFAHLLQGKFANTFIEFESQPHIKTWQGSTPCEQFCSSIGNYWGSTNVLGVADLFVSLKYKGYAESEFPTGALMISDGEFDSFSPSGSVNYRGRVIASQSSTTFVEFINRLRRGGFSEKFCQNFKLVLWDIPNGYYGRTKPCFESLADAPNFFYMSGFDPAGICFLTGKQLKSNIEAPTPKNAEELFFAAMDQDLLNMLTL